VKLNGKNVSRDSIDYNTRRYVQKDNSIISGINRRVMVITVKDLKPLKDSILSVYGSINYDVSNKEKGYFGHELSSLDVGDKVVLDQYNWSVIGVTNKTITFKINKEDNTRLFFESKGEEKNIVINRSSYQKSYSMVHSLSVSFEENLEIIDSWGVVKDGTPKNIDMIFQRDLRLPF
jgi:hypothetical protein